MKSPSPRHDLDQFDSLIRSGKAALVRSKLTTLCEGKLARTQLATIARLSWRVNLPQIGLRLLNPIVRPVRKQYLATAVEKAEYAACLTKVGAREEALSILEGLDSTEVPQSLLYRVFALAAGWNYRPTISLLEEFHGLAPLSPYQRQVGRVNLAAAFVFLRDNENANKILQELRAELASHETTLLRGNVLELSAQHAIHQGHWGEAEGFLGEATRALAEHSETMDQFLVRKWSAILNLLRSGAGETEIGRLHEVEKESRSRKHWEGVRECARFEAISRRDEALLIHLYFGTPFEPYRERLLLDWKRPIALPNFYEWRLINGSGPVLDPLEIVEAGKKTNGKLGLLPRQLLMALTADFYRPSRIATLFSRLYPGEFFNPISSPTRIHQLVQRARRWIRTQKLPLTIDEADGAYLLRATAPLSLRTYLGVKLGSRGDIAVRKLWEVFRDSPFSIGEAACCLKTSPHSALRALNEGQEKGAVNRLGRGPSTKYRIAKAV